jgi:predicted nucleic acid-binding protein
MPDNIFFDSNVWLYAFIAGEEGKHDVAAQLITCHAKHIIISTQVLNEVSVNLLKKANVNETFIQNFLAAW